MGRKRGSLLVRFPRSIAAIGLGVLLRYRAFAARTIGDLVEVAMHTNLFGLRITPLQLADELTEFLQFVEDTAPKTVLEIGTAKGGTLFLLCQVCPPDATLASIDFPEGEFGAGYQHWKLPLYKSFSRRGQTLYLVQGDSHDQQTRARLSNALSGRSVDLLFIDGDHTYEGARRDFEDYSPYVSEGGVIAFHDIRPGPAKDVGGVPRLWEELSTRFRSRAIRSKHCRECYGIGLVWREPIH